MNFHQIFRVYAEFQGGVSLLKKNKNKILKFLARCQKVTTSQKMDNIQARRICALKFGENDLTAMLR